MINFKTLLKLEGALLSLAGLIHLVFLFGFVSYSNTEPPLYFGGLFFGIIYLVAGISFLLNKTKLLIPTLIINIIGLTAVLVAQENSPLWVVDPYLIALDIVSIPTLVYLNWKTYRK